MEVNVRNSVAAVHQGEWTDNGAAEVDGVSGIIVDICFEHLEHSVFVIRTFKSARNGFRWLEVTYNHSHKTIQSIRKKENHTYPHHG